MKTNNKNGTIEFLRFVFCLCVLFSHICIFLIKPMFSNDIVQPQFFFRGYMAVEFFFVLAGILMAKSVDTKKMSGNVLEDTTKYIFKRFKSVFWPHIIAFFIMYTVKLMLGDFSFGQIMTITMNQLPGLLFLEMVGFPRNYLNTYEWFISAMLIVQLILYPLLRKKYEECAKFFFPIISIFLLGYLASEFGFLSLIGNWNGICYAGLIRALAEIALGVTCYEISKYLKNKKMDKVKRVLLTILELSCHALTILLMIFIFPKVTEFFMFALILVGTTLSFSEVTYSQKIFSNKVSYFLGSLSLPIYLAHASVIAIASNGLWFSDYMKMFVFVLTLTALFTAIIKIGSDFILKYKR